MPVHAENPKHWSLLVVHRSGPDVYVVELYDSMANTIRTGRVKQAFARIQGDFEVIQQASPAYLTFVEKFYTSRYIPSRVTLSTAARPSFY